MTKLAVLDELRARPGSGDTITIVDPVTEEQIRTFPSVASGNQAGAMRMASSDRIPIRDRKSAWTQI
jgi:aldehyde dehydrogenase (NAD+)